MRGVVFQRSLPGVVAGVLIALATGCGRSSPSVPSLSSPGSGDLASTGCGAVIDDALFANTDRLRHLTSVMAGFGLRSTASTAHDNTISWIENELSKLPGISIYSDPYTLSRWQPRPMAPNGIGRSLELAASLKVTPSGATSQSIAIAGVIPYALPTADAGQSGALVYIPSGTEITSENARGKIVVRDVPTAPIPFAGFAALSWYLTPDLIPALAGNYDRPYLATDGPLSEELVAAGVAGAAGVVEVFNVPREQIAGYWDPHRGTHFSVPAVYVGVDEGEAIKQAAANGGSASIAVFADRDDAMTRNLIATLPGQSSERIVLSTHTDGIGWIEENGDAALIALADYLSRRPLECRPRTIEFEFGSAHLHISKEGTARYAQQLDREYDEGTIAFTFAIEHLGTREILPAARTDGPGQRLEYTGQGEAMGWFVGESPVMAEATIAAVQRRSLDHIGVLRGQDIPDTARVPLHCSFGGIGSYFQSHLIPGMGIISGPWSLWAPSFGEEAVDVDRLRAQLLAVGDVILALAPVSRDVLAGAYPAERMLRGLGVPTCSTELPPEQAPGP